MLASHARDLGAIGAQQLLHQHLTGREQDRSAPFHELIAECRQEHGEATVLLSPSLKAFGCQGALAAHFLRAKRVASFFAGRGRCDGGSDLRWITVLSRGVASFFWSSDCIPNHPFVNPLPLRGGVRRLASARKSSFCDRPVGKARLNQGNVLE